jgi:hypothetical protein
MNHKSKYNMKKLLILMLIAGMPFFASAQSCSKAATASCDKTSCGPEGTKKGEAKVISSLRTDLQSVINKMSKSSLAFDKAIAEMTLAQGENDDESLLFISQAATSVRYELLNKIQSAKLIASLKDYKPSVFSSKQQMVSALKKEIEILASQAEKL